MDKEMFSIFKHEYLNVAFIQSLKLIFGIPSLKQDIVKVLFMFVYPVHLSLFL